MKLVSRWTGISVLTRIPVNSVMEFMRANPDLHVEPINTNGFYKDDEETAEELVQNKRIKLESDDMGLAQDFWHAR